MGIKYKSLFPRTAYRPVLILAGLACLIPITLALNACETLRVGSDYDRTADFAGYRSFSWLPRQDYGTRNPLIVERAREAIQSELRKKGYVYSADSGPADFAVDFTIGSQERVNVSTYPPPYAGPWYWYGPRWWGYRYWGTGVDVHRYREGTLAIDMFDAKTDKPVWHGWARKPLTRTDLEHSDVSIPEAVDAVLATFPPH